MEPAYKRLNVEEFLDGCPDDHRHYELIDGVIGAMAPTDTRHQIIAVNLAYEIGGAVRTNLPHCTVYGQAGIAPQGVRGRDHFETDITVTCAAQHSSRGILFEPLLIVGILSPSTERDDHFVKLPAYQTIPSVIEILYIETERVAATVYRRQADGWDETTAEGPEAGCSSRRSGSMRRSPRSIEAYHA